MGVVMRRIIIFLRLKWRETKFWLLLSAGIILSLYAMPFIGREIIRLLGGKFDFAAAFAMGFFIYIILLLLGIVIYLSYSAWAESILPWLKSNWWEAGDLAKRDNEYIKEYFDSLP
jgi:hypothetical protein